MKLGRGQKYLRTCHGRRVGNLCVPDLGGLGFSQIAVLVPGVTGDNWSVQFGAIFAMKSFEEWVGGKGVLIAF